MLGFAVDVVVTTGGLFALVFLMLLLGGVSRLEAEAGSMGLADWAIGLVGTAVGGWVAAKLAGRDGGLQGLCVGLVGEAVAAVLVTLKIVVTFMPGWGLVVCAIASPLAACSGSRRIR